MSSTITFANGQKLKPLLRYKATDYVPGSHWTSWGYGPRLTVTGSNTAPAASCIESLKHPCRDAVKFNGGTNKYLNAGSDTTSCNIGAGEDIWIELAITKRSNTGYVVAKRDPNAPNVGWLVYINGSGHVAFVKDHGAASQEIGTLPTTNGQSYFVCFFVDNSESNASFGAGAFLDGILRTVSNVSFSTITGTLVNSTALTFGATGAGAVQTDASLSYLAVYSAQNLWPGGNDNLVMSKALARQRYRDIAASAARWAL